MVPDEQLRAVPSMRVKGVASERTESQQNRQDVRPQYLVDVDEAVMGAEKWETRFTRTPRWHKWSVMKRGELRDTVARWSRCDRRCLLGNETRFC